MLMINRLCSKQYYLDKYDAITLTMLWYILVHCLLEANFYVQEIYSKVCTLETIVALVLVH